MSVQWIGCAPFRCQNHGSDSLHSSFAIQDVKRKHVARVKFFDAKTNEFVSMENVWKNYFSFINLFSGGDFMRCFSSFDALYAVLQ